MNEILNFVLSIVVIVLTGAFATFSFILNMHKKEIWDEIERRYFL